MYECFIYIFNYLYKYNATSYLSLAVDIAVRRSTSSHELKELSEFNEINEINEFNELTAQILQERNEMGKESKNFL